MNYKYFDNAATTRVNDEVLQAYNEACNEFYNPSSLYTPSLMVKNKIEMARENILRYLGGVNKSTFIFTSCATESNNAVLRNCIKRKDKKYIISAGEHSSTYNTAKAMINEGYNIEFAPLNEDGTVNQQALFTMIDNKTDFISLIHVSNETGAVNDIKYIAKKCKSINPNILIHSDGVQALHKLKINLVTMGVDFYTVSSHKINGVKGIAGLYIANPNKFTPFIYGGGQEMNLRGGTENFPAVMAFAKAMALPNDNYEQMCKIKRALLDNIILPYKLISNDDCVPNIVSICFPNLRGETLVHMLETDGFLIGTGSACNSKNTANRVLTEMGVDQEHILGAIRISFDKDCTEEDVIELAKAINKNVQLYYEKLGNMMSR
ncbi:MAG: cysteine desulfurase [Clostridia bacterium]|nr:cysteine desulfurase [Clostridia bacterium]